MLEARRHKTFKIKMGFGGAETETRRVVRTARAIHQLAPEAIVTVDLNQSWDMTTCMRLLPQMDDAGIAMVEQPLPFWNTDGMAALCSRLRLALVAADGLWWLGLSSRRDSLYRYGYTSVVSLAYTKKT